METLLLNYLAQMPIFHHARHVQVLHNHCAGQPGDECMGALVNVVGAYIRDAGVEPAEFVFFTCNIVRLDVAIPNTVCLILAGKCCAEGASTAF